MANSRSTRAKQASDVASVVQSGEAGKAAAGKSSHDGHASTLKRKTADDNPPASSEVKLTKKTKQANLSVPGSDVTAVCSPTQKVSEPCVPPDGEGFLSAWAMLRGLDKEDEDSMTESEGGSDKRTQLGPGVPRLYDTETYDLPDQCQVYDESQQVVMLKHLYQGLPRLEARAFIGWKEEYTSQGRMDFGSWDQYCPYMDLRKGLKALSFVAFQRVVHLARCDPRRFAARITPRSPGGRSMTMSDSDACVVSLAPIRVTNSQITEMNDARRKLISGVMHSQDMERFVSVICMVFGHKSMYCNLKDDEFTFETRPARKEGPSPENSPYKPSRAFATKSMSGVAQSPSTLSSGSGITAGYVQTSLSGSDPVRVYDGRNIGLNWSSDMGKVHTILPRFEGELLPGSFAVVAHTVTSYRKTQQGVVVGEATNLNVQWILLLGSLDQPRPARIRIASEGGQGFDLAGTGGRGPPGDGDGGDMGQAIGKGKASVAVEGYHTPEHTSPAT